MVFLRQSFLILVALALGGEMSFAVGAAKEQRAYAAAVSAFQDAMWSRAEMEFAQFVQKYPNSTNAPAAVLMQAQAEFKQGKFEPASALLKSRAAAAGNLADQYVYWTGEARFQNGDFSEAAEIFNSLAQNFPESPLRLRAVVEAASSRAQLAEWPAVAALLEETNGVFQRAAQMDSANEMVSRGRLLLAQAKFAQNDPAIATSVLESLNSQTLAPELDWQRAYLLCQIKLAASDLTAALALTTNLLQIVSADDDLRAESMALRGEVLEKMNRPAEAIAAYRENLKAGAPIQRQHEAVLKIAELASAQKQFSDAEQALEKFLAQFPGSPSADIALFTLGELQLKDYAAQPSATNQLQRATATFDQFLGVFTNSLLAGKAYLDRGWCYWIAEKYPESLADFKAAVQRLPFSEDLAAARFKVGDALFAQKDFPGALENYRRVLDDFGDLPAVSQTLGDRALYQSLRAQMELKDWDAASNTLARIVKNYPAGDWADSGALLFGEGLADAQQPPVARGLFQKFEEQSTNSPLLPQIELAIARTYEQEADWTNAIARYAGWLKSFPANALQPQAVYSLARANFQAGNETDAFSLFTNFVAQFPTNELAPVAQWWVADHYFRAPEPDHFVNAERNYKFIFQNTNWQNSPLIYQAQMMAGRAAVGRLGYSDAIGYFTALVADTNCPPELDVQARFAWGSALMRSDSTDTNNPLLNFQSATNVFGRICQLYPTNEWGALALGELADCYLQLTNYDAATNAYAQVFNSPVAGISARSQAQIGFGIALEKMAALAAATNQTALFQLALQNYSDVLYENNLREAEQPDPFWRKKAGLQAANLAEMLANYEVATNVYAHLEELFPQARDSFEKKIAAAQALSLPGKN
jgi:TolA-binding protein